MSWVRRGLESEALRIHRRPLVAGQPIPEQVAAQYEFAALTREQLLAFSAQTELELPRESVERRCASGDVCVGVLEQGRLVAYCWFATRGSAPFSATLDIQFDPDGQVYAYKMFTLPSHRGKRLQLYNVRYGDTELSRRGFTHSIGYVRSSNFASRKSLARLPGDEQVGWIVYALWLGRLRCFVTSGARHHGIGLVAASPAMPTVEPWPARRLG